MATGVLRNLERFFAASGERPPRQSRLLEALERDGWTMATASEPESPCREAKES